MRSGSLLFSIVIVYALLENGALAEDNDVTAEDIKSWAVTVTPRVQKVAEGSTVVFTCESSLPVNVRFQWTKSSKPIGKKDSIEITQIAHNLSVLRIEKAHLKKHRRVFRCTVFYDDRATQSVLDRNADATLKIIANKKIPRNFPKVTSRVYEELLETRPGYIPLVCDIEGSWSKSFPLYTWYKDSVINLGFQEKNWENDGMRILYVEPSQANGTFQCAAFYKKGSVTAYGNVIPADIIVSQIKGGCADYNGTMVGHGDMFYRSACEHCECANGDVGFCATINCVRPPPGCYAKEGGACCDYVCHDLMTSCIDYNGQTVNDGELYRRGSNPCESCLCSGGEATLCSEAVCDAPPCRNYNLIPDTCCGFECLDCASYNGTWVVEGESYAPTSDPCETCVCNKGNPSYCFNVACMKPEMECPDPMPIPGECCKFTCDKYPSLNETVLRERCISFNGTTVPDGQRYKPDSDHCKTCTCKDGNPEYCMVVACRPPRDCKNPQAKPGVCCQFDCGESIAITEKGCVSFNDTHVPEGQRYKPDGDHCKTCTCRDGNPEYCMVVACRPPRDCKNPQPKPGVCCQFDCGESIAITEKGKRFSIRMYVIQWYKCTRRSKYKSDSDHCKMCACKEGTPEYCMVVACRPPRDCKNPQAKPGVCCQFDCGESIAIREKGCKAYNGTIVPEGFMYSPERDACKQCSCIDGSPRHCLNVRCFAPPMPCDNPTPVPGVCCQFTCNREVVMDTKGCETYNGSIVPEGYIYSPERDACKQCTCIDGSPKYCLSVACLAPPMPCDDPTTLPGVCCQFTCNKSVAMETTGCMSYNGTMVPYGTRYQPSEDPCKICECSESDGVCMMVRCAMPRMPCFNPSRVPNECCSFTCNVTMTRPAVPMSEDDYQSVRIRPFIQQIGPQAVMIHWEIPDIGRFSDVRDISVSIEGPNDYFGHFDGQHGVDHVIVRGLNQSVIYEVFGYARVKWGDLNDKRIPEYVRKVDLMLEAKATASLNLRHAIGEVYESRGAIDRGSFSLPQPFERVMVDKNFQVMLNLNTFNRVEMSTYMAKPCSKAECGLLRFYMYNMTGHAHNVMSLMFIEDMDFDWAMAHL